MCWTGAKQIEEADSLWSGTASTDSKDTLPPVGAEFSPIVDVGYVILNTKGHETGTRGKIEEKTIILKELCRQRDMSTKYLLEVFYLLIKILRPWVCQKTIFRTFVVLQPLTSKIHTKDTQNPGASTKEKHLFT